MGSASVGWKRYILGLNYSLITVHMVTDGGRSSCCYIGTRQVALYMSATSKLQCQGERVHEEVRGGCRRELKLRHRRCLGPHRTLTEEAAQRDRGWIFLGRLRERRREPPGSAAIASRVIVGQRLDPTWRWRARSRPAAARAWGNHWLEWEERAEQPFACSR